MKSVTFAVVAIAVMMLSVPASSKENPAAGECAAPMLEVVDGGISVTEDGKTSRIKAAAPGKEKTASLRATTSCRSSGGYTVCSNGRYGCVWSERSGNLLGCGRGI